MEIQRTLLALLICVAAYFPLCSNAYADPIDTELENTITKVIQAFHGKDISAINQMINKKYGLTILFRQGVFDEYKTIEEVDINKPVPEYLPYSFGCQTDFKLKYEALPTYDCEVEKWSKTGLYCDLTKKDNLLSTTVYNLKQLRGDKIAQDTIDGFKAMEEKSHRVVLVGEDGGELVFYLTLIGNRWYLTILDRVSDDCGA